MRALVLALPALVASVLFTAPAAAQASEHGPRLDAQAALALDASYDRELRAIDAEADAATALYVTGVILHVGGLGAMVGTGIAGFCISFTSSCSGAHELAQNGSIIGGSIALLGLVGIFVGVGLDVDSGHRRRDLGARPSLALDFAPSTDGASLSLRGTF